MSAGSAGPTGGLTRRRFLQGIVGGAVALTATACGGSPFSSSATPLPAKTPAAGTTPTSGGRPTPLPPILDAGTHTPVTYYVDATHGVDTNDGADAERAWKTIGRVNKATLKAGDKLLFKRGEHWTGQVFNVTWSGAVSAPVLIGAYGSGPAPILDGGGKSNCMVTKNQRYLRVENLELQNSPDFCALFSTCAEVTVADCNMHHAGNDCLNFFDGCTNIRVLRGQYHHSFPAKPGPQTTGIEIANGGSGFLIDSVEMHNNQGAGISVHNHVGTLTPDKVILRNCNIHDNNPFGMLMFKQDVAPDTTVQVICCLFENNLDGIHITKAQATTAYPQGLTVENTEFRNNTRYTVWAEGDDLAFHRCLFDNGRMFLARDCKNLEIYHGTFYLTKWAEFRPLTITGARTDGITVRNCVFSTDDVATQIIGVEPGTAGKLDIDYNLYQVPDPAKPRFDWHSDLLTFPQWQRRSGMDSHSPAPADPRFTNRTKGDFTLAGGSPAIDAGTDVGLSYTGSAPDLGYAEYGAANVCNVSGAAR